MTEVDDFLNSKRVQRGPRFHGAVLRNLVIVRTIDHSGSFFEIIIVRDGEENVTPRLEAKRSRQSDAYDQEQINSLRSMIMYFSTSACSVLVLSGLTFLASLGNAEMLRGVLP